MGGVWEKSWGLCRALHVVRGRLQGVRCRRGAVEDVPRLAKAVGSQGSGGGPGAGWRDGRAGRGGSGDGRGGGGGPGRAAGLGGATCRSHGNVRIVSEVLQMFRSKERAWKEFLEKNGRGGLENECIL